MSNARLLGLGSQGARAQVLSLPYLTPGGRLTLTTATPVMTATASAQTTVYYTPWQHQYVPIWSGQRFFLIDIGGELSQLTTDAGKSPAAVTTNSNYDYFVWLDQGTPRCTRGPLWTSDTGRGAGVGTTELERVQGVMVNKNQIVAGPAARFGTYVGTVRSNGSSQIDYTFGSSAAGGGAASFGVWNCYNRVPVVGSVVDSSAPYNYTSATTRSADNSASNRISFVRGLNEDGVTASFGNRGQTAAAASAFGFIDIGLDSTTVAAGRRAYVIAVGTSACNMSIAAQYAGLPGLGFHFLQALETGDGTNATNWTGSADFLLQATLMT